MMTTLQKIMPAHVPVLLEMLKRLQNFDFNDSSPLVKTKKIMITVGDNEDEEYHDDNKDEEDRDESKDEEDRDDSRGEREWFFDFGNGNGNCSTHSQILGTGTGMKNSIPNFWEWERE